MTEPEHVHSEVGPAGGSIDCPTCLAREARVEKLEEGLRDYIEETEQRGKQLLGTYGVLNSLRQVLSEGERTEPINEGGGPDA